MGFYEASLKPEASYQTIKLKVAEKIQEPPTLPPQKENRPREALPPRKPEQRRAKTAPKPSAERVQGLTQESLGAEQSSLAVPLGNTLMTKDLGKRLTPEEIQALERNLSSDALLVRESLQPHLTLLRLCGLVLRAGMLWMYL